MELTLKGINDIDIESLASIYDKESRDLYVSMFADLTDPKWEKFITQRTDMIKKVLKGNRMLQDNFVKSMELITDIVNKNAVPKGAKSLVIFLSSDLEYEYGAFLPLPMENLLIVDTSPYIRPLALLKDEYEDYVLAVLDSENFKVFCISSSQVTCTDHKETELIGKHKKGGWSQQRFARLRREGIDKFQKQIAEDLNEIFKEGNYKGIIVAGPGLEKKNFVDELPPDLREKVVKQLDVDFDIHLSDLLNRAGDAMHEHEDQDENHLVEVLREGILKGSPVVYGLDETQAMVKQSRAGILLVDPDLKVAGHICEACQIVKKGSPKPCKQCGGQTSDVDVVEEIIEFAYRMNTRVEFVKSNEFLESLGGVAALLRY